MHYLWEYCYMQVLTQHSSFQSYGTYIFDLRRGIYKTANSNPVVDNGYSRDFGMGDLCAP